MWQEKTLPQHTGPRAGQHLSPAVRGLPCDRVLPGGGDKTSIATKILSFGATNVPVESHWACIMRGVMMTPQWR